MKMVLIQEEKCIKTVQKVVQVSQKKPEVMVVIFDGMYYNECIME